MSNHVTVVSLLITVLVAGTAQAVNFGDLMNSAGGLLDGASGTAGGGSPAAGAQPAGSSLSTSQIDAGLKQALSIGAERAVDVLGKNGGFLDDGSVRIPLPGVLGTAAQGLRAAGQGKYVDDFEMTMNRAAEQAVPQTLDIVKRTVSGMSLEDVRGILAGGDSAATDFLRERAGGDLAEAIRPIVSQATDSAGATAAYKTLVKQAEGLGGGIGGLGGLGNLAGLAGMVDTQALDLDGYVTGKTLDGLFLKLAAEEKAIRENPVARSTDLLKSVFGN